MAIIHQEAIKRAESGVDLRACEGCAVKRNADGRLVLCAASDTAPLGVVHVGGNVGEMTDYILPGNSSIVGVKLHKDCGAVTEGTKLVLAANGTLKQAATGTAIAVACEAGVGEQLVEAYLIPPAALA